MNDGFSWWLVVLGIAVGIGLVWLFTVRLPVSESDIDTEERAEEAGWISETIESWGGVAPTHMNSVAPISMTGTPGSLWKWGTTCSAMETPVMPRLDGTCCGTQ